MLLHAYHLVTGNGVHHALGQQIILSDFVKLSPSPAHNKQNMRNVDHQHFPVFATLYHQHTIQPFLAQPNLHVYDNPKSLHIDEIIGIIDCLLNSKDIQHSM